MKILATTDFSVNSKAGLRFAISLAKLNKAHLIFFHSYYLPKPTSWSEATFLQYEKNEKQKILIRFNQFVAAVYKSMNILPENFQCVMERGLVAESSIMDFAKNQAIDFICICTRGAGMVKKFFGTTAGNLITKSQVPVIVVPHHYKIRTITHILYASDLKHYEQELIKVIEFSKPFKASIEVFHLSYPALELFDVGAIAANLKKQFKHKIKLHLENTDLTQPLVDSLQKAIASSKSSVIVMFTEQRRSFFQKLFLSSATESIAFQTKVPMLVFNKTAK